MANMDIVLVPSAGKEWLVFPQALVSRVFPYAPPLTADSDNEFVIGSMLVQNEKMPVVDFEFTPSEQVYEGNRQIVLVASISESVRFLRYAVISYGEPVLLNIGETQIHRKEGSKHRYIAQYVEIAGENINAVILDLEQFESEVRMK